MQQVKVEIISPEAGETPLARPFNSVPCYMCRPHFGYQEYVFTPTTNNVTNQFLPVTISVNLRRIDQGHAQRNAFAQRFFLGRLGVSSLAQPCRTLTERWDDGSVVEFHGSRRLICSNIGRSRCR